MFTDRKLKKRLQKEADMLVQAKKEQMLSFYHPAEEKRTRRKGISARRLVAVSLAVLLLATGTVAALLLSTGREEPVVSDPKLPSESVPAAGSESVPPAVSGTESGYENADIRPGIYGLDYPYAIVEILGGTEETLGRYSYGTWYDYTKIKCKVLYSYMSETFSKKDGEENHYVPFDELQEIYILSDFADDLKPNDVIFFRVEELELSGEVAADRHLCYGPDSRGGKAEYLPFIDGKLVIPEGTFNSGSFGALDFVNWEIEVILERGSEEVHPALYEACPKYLFEEGLDIEQVIAFFDICKVFREAYERYAEKQTDCCNIYVSEGW